jgi:hypothetical protein
MTEREALKLAMDALERSVATCFYEYAHQQVMSRPDHFINQTITAIKEALAQPQRTWVGLTDDEINEAYLSDTDMSLETPWVLQFGSALEAKLKEKNT